MDIDTIMKIPRYLILTARNFNIFNQFSMMVFGGGSQRAFRAIRDLEKNVRDT